jgi:hypothetical protein
MTGRVQIEMTFKHRVETVSGKTGHMFRYVRPDGTEDQLIYPLKAAKFSPGAVYTVEAELDEGGKPSSIYLKTIAFHSREGVSPEDRLVWDAEDRAIDRAKNKKAAERKAKEDTAIAQETERLKALIAGLPRHTRFDVIDAIRDELTKGVMR